MIQLPDLSDFTLTDRALLWLALNCMDRGWWSGVRALGFERETFTDGTDGRAVTAWIRERGGIALTIEVTGGGLDWDFSCSKGAVSYELFS